MDLTTKRVCRQSPHMLHFTLFSIFHGSEDKFLCSLIDTNVLYFHSVLADDAIRTLQESCLVLAHDLVNLNPETGRITENCRHSLPQFFSCTSVSMRYHPIPNYTMLFGFKLPRNIGQL